MVSAIVMTNPIAPNAKSVSETKADKAARVVRAVKAASRIRVASHPVADPAAARPAAAGNPAAADKTAREDAVIRIRIASARRVEHFS